MNNQSSIQEKVDLYCMLYCTWHKEKTHKAELSFFIMSRLHDSLKKTKTTYELTNDRRISFFPFETKGLKNRMKMILLSYFRVVNEYST